MSTMTADEVWRDFNVNGVPASGDHKPVKAEIRQWARMIDQRVGAGVTRRTVAQLNGVVPTSGTFPLGAVTSDPSPSNNGFYTWSGSAWQFARPFPDTLAVLVGIGGTPNSVTASTRPGIDPAQIIVYLLQPAATNSGAVSLSINGGPAKPVFDVQGAPLTPGLWTVGRLVQVVDNGDEYRLVSDPDADGAAASAAASAAEAQMWAESASQIAVPDGSITDQKLNAVLKGRLVAFAPNRTVLAAFDGLTYQSVDLMEAGRKGLFMWDGADLSAEVAADTQQGLYVAPSGDPTGASGAWVRQFDGPVLATWFGAHPSNADNTPNYSALIAVCPAGSTIKWPSIPGEWAGFFHAGTKPLNLILGNGNVFCEPMRPGEYGGPIFWFEGSKTQITTLTASGLFHAL